MKSPLAYLRGFQVASGVPLEMPPLKELVLKRYFYRERMARLREAEALSYAMIATVTHRGEPAAKAFQALKNILLPEFAEEIEDFGKVAKSTMAAWQDKVLVLEPFKAGKAIAAKATLHKLSEMADQIRKIRPIQKEKLRQRLNPFKKRKKA